MLKSLFLLISVAFLSFQLAAQETFSNDREKFVKEFQKYMSSNSSEEVGPFIKKELTPMLLETSDFPDEYFNKMVATANLMIEKRLKAFPEVYNYVFSVYSIVEAKQPKTSYNAWHEAVDKMLALRNVRKFKEFITTSGGYFSKQLLTGTSNFEWYYLGGDFQFRYTDKPYLDLTNGALVCRIINKNSKTAKKMPYLDSIVIYNTTGVYDPLLEKWEAKGGKITWEKVGLDVNKTFAMIKDYNISLRSSSFNCDSVELTTPYFENTLLGKLTERALKINREVDKKYPQFLSYERRLKIENIVPDVDYIGGFALQGADFIGLGNAENPAELSFYRNQNTFVKTNSQVVQVSPDKIITNNASVVMSVGLKDSITHPGLDVIFNLEKNELELKRGTKGVSKAPFSNSYHMVDMYVEQMVWNRDSANVKLSYNFATSAEQRIARFESKNYYDPVLYEALQGMEAVHPLVGLSQYSYKYDEYIFNEGKAASAIGRTIEQAKPTLLNLANLGFIDYDTDRGIVAIKPKLENFIAARAGKKDYDNLLFVADLRPMRMDGIPREELEKNPELKARKEAVDKRNQERSRLSSFGIVDLSSLEMRLVAIDQVKISDVQNTQLFPEGNKVTVKQNRSIDFNGWANVGKLEIHLDAANYNYEKNKINVVDSDKALFRLRPLSERDGEDAIAMQSLIEGITGEILIDDPENRSGNKKDEVGYPILVSKEKSKIFYDYKEIYVNAYEKERFFFELDAFELSHLDDFKEDTLQLSGELTSAGIFPKFKQSVKVMPDYSFGFKAASPDAGYDFYGKKAKYNDSILLSNNGLQGRGVIDFINSRSESINLFTFLPDSTVGIANFVNKPQETGVQFPDVESPDAYITYIPNSQVLKARSTKTQLKFFKGEANLNGEAVIRSSGMTGSGFMDFATASLGSEFFRFKRWDIDADTSNFNLRNRFTEEGVDEDPLAMKTENVQASISFKDRKGEFKSNAGESTVTFPVNQYVCKMDMFSWFMDKDELELEAAESEEVNIDSDLDFVGPNFFSINPKQDSLSFRAPKARFSLREKTIYCSKTEFLDIADARIYPDSMKLVIRKKAKMDPLLNSKIVANYITKYHTITNATTEITGRRAYTSTGNYPYYDLDSNVTMIVMDKIYLDTTYQTIATGKIAADQDFTLSPTFDFYGEVKMKASDPNMMFTGATRIKHECEKFDKNWMSFEAPIDPKNIQIPVSESMKDLEGNAISAGIVWRHSADPDSLGLYPTFLSTLVDKEDPIVISASGWLQYDIDAKEYQIGTKEKLINRSAPGNYISLHTESCSMNGDGKIDLGMDYGDMIVETVGVVNYNQESGKTSMNITAMIKTPLDKGLMEGVAEKINAEPGLPPADFNSTTLEQAIATWTDQKTADKIKSDFTLKGEYKKVPKEMDETFVITGINMESYDEFGVMQKGLRTTTDQAAIVNMYGVPVMKYVPFKMFAEQRTAFGDKLTWMIDLPAGSLYLFDYDYRKKDGTMNILTGDAELNTALQEMKEDKRKVKKFTYQQTSNGSYRSIFLRIFGGDE